MADFFDKMKDGFNKGVATVSTGSKTVIEKSKISTIIKSLEDENRQLAEILGNRVYSFYMNNIDKDIPNGEVCNICNEITIRNEQIEVQKRKMEALDAEMSQVMGNGQSSNLTNVCQCGQANASKAKFCRRCGNPLM